MKIADAINNCDVGDTVTTSGTIRWVGKPRHITGEKNGKPYDFWGQFVVIAEGDGPSLGVDVTFPSEDKHIANAGAAVKVKGTLDSYIKDGETQYALRKSSIEFAAGQQNRPSGTSQKNSNAELMIKYRSMALSYAKDLACDDRIPIDRIKNYTLTFNAFITTGEWLYSEPAEQAFDPDQEGVP